MQATSRKINGWRMFGIHSQKKISYIHTAGVRSQQDRDTKIIYFGMTHENF